MVRCNKKRRDRSERKFQTFPLKERERDNYEYGYEIKNQKNLEGSSIIGDHIVPNIEGGQSFDISMWRA